jgi:hypothetical protein
MLKPVCLAMLTGAFVLAGPPQVGMVNAFTGRVGVDRGKSFNTEEGMAELLLSPGSFLRLGNHSQLTIEIRLKTEISVRLRKGEALLEVLDLQAPLVLEQDSVTIVVLKPGLYDFNATRGTIAVYAGEVRLINDGKQSVAGAGFGVKKSPHTATPLFAWSRTRSQQLSSESAAAAQSYAGGAAKPHGSEWFWDPWAASYTYLSASGVVTGPFGWPYYSPGYTPNYISVHPSGDSGLYGPPVLSLPGPPQLPAPRSVTPTVPLTAPGVPQFPTGR